MGSSRLERTMPSHSAALCARATALASALALTTTAVASSAFLGPLSRASRCLLAAGAPEERLSAGGGGSDDARAAR